MISFLFTFGHAGFDITRSEGVERSLISGELAFAGGRIEYEVQARVGTLASWIGLGICASQVLARVRSIELEVFHDFFCDRGERNDVLVRTADLSSVLVCGKRVVDNRKSSVNWFGDC